MKRFAHIFIAGTFDGLHAGHRRLLTEAFARGSKVTIGLTSEEFVRTFKIQNSKFIIRSYATRKQDLQVWLGSEGYSQGATIIPISDPYEPAASMKDLDALIVTADNRTTGERINKLRQGSTLSPLALIEMPMVAAEDGKPISSTRMRKGEIDGNGRLVMPESLRRALGEPMGKILRGKEIGIAIRLHKNDTVITVGDLSTKTLLDAGVLPQLAIIDRKVGRMPYAAAYQILKSQARLWGAQKPGFKKVQSGPGFISREAVEAIERCFAPSLLHKSKARLWGAQKPGFVTRHDVVIIDGEEDLLVLPAIQYAPLGSVLYYGQPGEGLVEVIVTKEIQKKCQDLLLKFYIDAK